MFAQRRRKDACHVGRICRGFFKKKKLNRGQQCIHERRKRHVIEEVSVELKESKIAARDKRAADVFLVDLTACRLVIPLYVLYAIYLYWTLPVAVRYSGGGY